MNQTNDDTSPKSVKYQDDCNKLIDEMLHPKIQFKTPYTEGEVGSVLGLKQSAIALRQKAWKMKNEQILQNQIQKKLMMQAINEGVKNESETTQQ